MTPRTPRLDMAASICIVRGMGTQTIREANDRRLEQLFAKKADAEDRLAELEAKGYKYSARHQRRVIGGIKAAITRTSRNMELWNA